MPKIVPVTVAAEHVGRKPATLRKWRQRGKLTDHGHDEEGRALVDLAEVEQLTLVNPAQLKAQGQIVITELGQRGERMVTAAQAAQVLGVSVSTVRTWASRGYRDAAGNTVKIAVTGLTADGVNLYYFIDLARAEHATRRRAGRERKWPDASHY